MEIQDLKSLVRKIKTVRILVIGDLMLDRFVRGDVLRVSDEAAVPVLDFTSEVIRPGGAANAICNILALGGDVAAVGVIGNDSDGACLKKILADAGADISGILVSKKRRTTQKTRIIAEKNQQHLMRIDKNNNMDIQDDIVQTLLDRIRSLIDSADAILVSDYDDGVITTSLIEDLIPLVKEKHKTIVIDSRITHFMDYREVDVVKVNHLVASEITGITQINETSIRNIGQWMLTQLGSMYVLITEGRDGMTLFDKKGDVYHIPSIARETREATGVADTVAAVIALSLGVDQMRIVEAAVLANTTAGIKVEKIGAATVTCEELEKTLDSLAGTPLVRKIKN